MSAADKVSKGLKTAAGIATVLAVKVDVNDQHGDVQSVKMLGFIPLFRRDAEGRARILGFRAKRLDR